MVWNIRRIRLYTNIETFKRKGNEHELPFWHLSENREHTVILPPLISTDERSSLLIMQDTARLSLAVITEKTLDDPEQAKDGECQCAPVDEGR